MKSYYILFLFILPCPVLAQSISGSAHDLSASGSLGNYICEYCHTPHAAIPATPLWSRDLPGTVYTMYDENTSSTSEIPYNAAGLPDGTSILCLSCHDGTIAPTSPDRTIPEGSSAILGSDLSDDHPISFVYDASLASSDGQLLMAPVYPAGLDGNNKMQCTSCHNPHDDGNGSFLVTTYEYANLCLLCHDRYNWSGSTHNSSTATWNGTGTNPWAHLANPYSTVAQNGCVGCHGMHTTGGDTRLMKVSPEENNCLDCHNGNVAASNKNIMAELTKTYRHDVTAYDLVHEPNEAALLPVSSMHVECADCHNPHESNASTAIAPDANGCISGVQGVDSEGISKSRIDYEYELCFRCHSDYPVTASLLSRQITQANTRLEFAAAAISFHPVETVGKNSDVPTLIAPLSESSMMYCTDCHASNGTTAPAGPHGSIYPQILKYQYETTDYTTESAQAYELCYSCHDRTLFITDAGDNVQRDVHYTHVVGADTPCSVCHDPHGISELDGTATANSHLINFDMTVVAAVSGNAYFQDDGYRTGSCVLRCHNRGHNPRSY